MKTCIISDKGYLLVRVVAALLHLTVSPQTADILRQKSLTVHLSSWVAKIQNFSRVDKPAT
jgi:uncharacterized membrane protein required for colicin V production